MSKNTDINKGKEVSSINLNLQTKAAQYLVQQGQAKEGGGGASSKNKYRFRYSPSSSCMFYAMMFPSTA